jgi:hypothetical protein
MNPGFPVPTPCLGGEFPAFFSSNQAPAGKHPAPTKTSGAPAQTSAAATKTSHAAAKTSAAAAGTSHAALKTDGVNAFHCPSAEKAIQVWKNKGPDEKILSPQNTIYLSCFVQYRLIKIQHFCNIE